MNILMVHNHYKVAGGEDTVVVNEKRLLEEHGNRVVLYERDNSELDKLSLYKKILVPLESIFSFRTFADICSIIKLEKIDVVHVHNTFLRVSPSVYYAALKSGVPVCQTIHNFRFQCPDALFFRDGHICEDCMIRGLYSSVKHKCYHGSYIQTFICILNLKLHRSLGILKKINFICLTEFNKNKLIGLNHGGHKLIEESKVFVKPNFVFKSDLISQNEFHQVNMSSYYTFVGRLDITKGIYVILEAFSKMQDKFLVVIGDGPEKGRIEDYIQTRELKNIQLTGYLKKDSILQYLKKTKAVIVPSLLYEGCPMSIIEAFEQGVPIIGSNIGNVASMIDAERNGILFEKGSSERLIAAVVHFEQLELEYLKKNAYATFCEKYEAETNYQALISIYRHIIDGNI